MGSVSVNLKKEVDNSYEIIVEPGCLSGIASDLKGRKLGHRYAIITDSNAGPLYAERLSRDFTAEGLDAEIIEFDAGEVYKNRETKAYLEDEMQRRGFGRDACIVAVGGGVVGDMAGFVAATYNRGVPFVQVPTTLMAQVDSSIGGKVAVDTPLGKNLVGAFYQPKRVYIDTKTLRTLPKEHVAGGMAEVIKHGLICDEYYFEFLRENSCAIRNVDDDGVLTKMIQRSCEIKGRVVELDEKEENIRATLNYGHTISHAIEQSSGFTIHHGYGVSIGSVFAAKLSVKRGLLRPVELHELTATFERFGLPVSMPKLDREKLLSAMHKDKKSEKGRNMFVLLKGIGEVATLDGRYKFPVTDEEVVQALYG